MQWMLQGDGSCNVLEAATALCISGAALGAVLSLPLGAERTAGDQRSTEGGEQKQS